MRVTWGQVTVLTLALATGGAIWKASPAVRTAVQAQGGEWLGWTEEARRADPAGFTSHVERSLRGELTDLEQCRTSLLAGVDQLGSTIRQQEARRDQARRLADEFRAAYQQARRDGRFPIVVRGAAYTEEQSVAQVSLLIAERDGFERETDRLRRIEGESQQRLQDLTLRRNATESQLGAIGAQRELLRSRRLDMAGERLIAQVDELMEGNRRVLHDNPVRSLEELVNDSRATASSPFANQEVARQFLAAVQEAIKPVSPEDRAAASVKPDRHDQERGSTEGKSTSSVEADVFDFELRSAVADALRPQGQDSRDTASK